MRINFLLPTTEVYGGIRAVLEISNVLEKRGHSVRLLIPVIKTLPKNAPLESLKRVLAYRQKQEDIKTIDWFDFKGEIQIVPHMILTKYFPNQWVPDADVTVATWWKSAYYLDTYPSSKGKKFYFIQHFETHAGNPETVKQTYQLPLNQIVTSTSLKEKIETLSNRIRGQVLYGVDFDTFYKEKEGYEVQEPIRIGMMYSNREWKGNAEGLEAYRRVKNQSSNTVQLVLFGRERDDGVPEDAEFHTDPGQDQLREIYNSMDIFMMPSHHEGFGMPPMEAMACGTACVATNVGGIPDFTRPGETVEVVPPKNADLLTQTLQRLIDNPKQIENIAKEGHNHIQQFTWENCGKKFEELIITDWEE